MGSKRNRIKGGPFIKRGPRLSCQRGIYPPATPLSVTLLLLRLWHSWLK